MELFETALVLSLLFSGIAADIPVTPRAPLDQPRIEISASQVITVTPLSEQDSIKQEMPSIQSGSFAQVIERVQKEEQRKLEEAQAAERARIEAERVAAEKAEQQRVAALQAKAQQAAATSQYPVYGDWETLIRNRCAQVGCDVAQVLRVMYCESGGRSNAKNPNSSATGLFQFMPPTFRANATRSGVDGANIWDPVAQIHVATWMFANGQAHQWVCK